MLGFALGAYAGYRWFAARVATDATVDAAPPVDARTAKRVDAGKPDGRTTPTQRRRASTDRRVPERRAPRKDEEPARSSLIGGLFATDNLAASYSRGTLRSDYHRRWRA